jgi:alpha-N-arabinofuranosidase
MRYSTSSLKRKGAWIGIGSCLVLIITACNSLQDSKFVPNNPQAVYAQDKQLAQNPGFEEGGSPAPRYWTWDQKRSGKKGSVSLDLSRYHSGQSSLKLQPNSRNVDVDPLAITQIIPAAEYRGQKVEFSGYLISEGNTQGILGMMSLVRGAPQGGPDMLFQAGSNGADWVQHRKIYNVPDDPSVQLVLICMSNGKSGASWFDDLSVVPVSGAGSKSDSNTDPLTPLKATISVDASKAVRTIPRTLYGTNIEWRWNGLNLWREKERRLDPKLTGLTKDLGVTLIRYPGGLFSDFYHWRTGIGPLDRRPEVKHEPGRDDKSRPFFGTEEVLSFAREVGAEVWITVNAGTGTAQEAGDWVKYVNGETQRVRFWEVGNELYIRSPEPVFKTITIDPAAYAKRFGEFARAMRAADPNIKVAAIGGENYGRFAFVGYPNWLKTVIEREGDQIDFISTHNAYAPIISEDNVDFRAVYSAMLAAPVLIGRNLQTVSDIIAKSAPNRASQIKIAVTEWGPAYRFAIDSKWVDHVKTLGSALFSASVLKTLIESPKVEVANFLMLHDFSVYGAIGSRNTDFPPNHDWIPTARYYAFQLYTRHFGDQLLKTATQAPTFDSPAVGYTDAVKGAPYLDVVSSLSADGRQLYIIAINKHFDQPIEAAITLRGFVPSRQATAWTMNGTGLDANTGTGIIKAPGLRVPKQAEDPRNPRFYKGGEGEITFRPSQLSAAGPEFVYSFPAHSATSIVLSRN